MLFLLAACRSVHGAGPAPPEPPRELRAAWVATVANIDWPSRPGLPTDAQQREALAILDRLSELRFNAVVFQVRPHCDALYASDLEPWSAYLTGREGRAPEPYYDPLEFWVREAHARGMQLHAWFNPYRAQHPSRPGPPAETSVLRTHPGLAVTLGDSDYRWLDPARDEVRAWSKRVVMDVVERYDVDGVHFDDYFYPYASYSDGADFPDDQTYAEYLALGGRRGRSGFRRQAVDVFIQGLDRALEGSGVHFGISPFGIWRPGHPPGIQGMDQYEALYADARRWLVEGWVDYLMPQLYWPIAQAPQSFPVLLGWWTRQNPRGRHVWPGTSIARMRREGGATELVNQVMITRGLAPDGPGICLFSARHLMPEDSALAAALRDGPFARPALPPETPWLEGRRVRRPALAADTDGLEIAPHSTPPLVWLVEERIGDAWRQRIVPGVTARVAWDGERPDRVVVRGVDRRGVLGAPARLDAPPLRSPASP